MPLNILLCVCVCVCVCVRAHAHACAWVCMCKTISIVQPQELWLFPEFHIRLYLFFSMENSSSVKIKGAHQRFDVFPAGQSL